VGDANRGEYITGFAERKQVLAFIKTFFAVRLPDLRGIHFFCNTANLR